MSGDMYNTNKRMLGLDQEQMADYSAQTSWTQPALLNLRANGLLFDSRVMVPLPWLNLRHMADYPAHTSR